jgi:LuxR family transcriptional regulator
MPNEKTILTEMQKLSDAADAGFALAFHIQYTRPTYLFQTYPDAWIREYSEKGLVMSDPTVHWGFENDGFKRWSELAGEDSAGVLTQAGAHGLTYGVTCAFGNDNARSMCSFARSTREFSDEECATLLSCVQAMHEATDGLTALDDATLQQLAAMDVKVSQPGGR